ncbi:MAG: Site-specific recombinase [Bacteroidetes bacterium]|nr:MAG: Site-specific recombinase [Bacteroidota bacterium]
MEKQIDVVLPYLVDSNNGTYFVEYRCFYIKTNRLERFRVYKGFAKLCPEQVAGHAKKIISHLTDKLKSGWRPWDGNNVIYRDEIEYHNVVSITGRTRKDKNQIRRYFSEFLTYKKSDVSLKSYETYQSKIRRFELWLESNGYGELLLSQLTNEIITKYFIYLIQKRKLDSVTVKNYRILISSMFAYFLKTKLIKENPVHDIPRASKLVDNAARPITDRDMKKYLEYVALHDKQMLVASLFQFFLLLRPGQELRLMKVQDIDLHRKAAYVADNNAKMRKRVVTIPQALEELILNANLLAFDANFYIFGKYGEPGPVTVGKNHFNRKFRIYRDILKLSEKYSFYSLKHTGAGILMESGATLAELMAQLGHTSFESTIHYVRRHFGEKSQKVVNLRPEFLKGII